MNDSGLGIDPGPLTGPAQFTNENIFETSFLSKQSESPVEMHTTDSIIGSSGALTGKASAAGMSESTARAKDPSSNSKSLQDNGIGPLDRPPLTSIDDDIMPGLPASRPHRSSLKRTYTDIAGYSLQHKLSEALHQPLPSSRQSSIPSSATISSQQPTRSNTVAERAPHGHRNAPAQAIFTTETKAPWTITAANDLACLVFGVTRAEVRKLGIMEVIKEERRKWLEDKLRNPESGTAPKVSRQQLPPTGKATLAPSLASMGNGLTARLLSKPPARETYQSRRTKSEDGQRPSEKELHHPNNKSRGVLLCGDVVPIRKMNGATGSASLWVKEKGNNLIWVLEEIAEDVAMLTVDEIGSVLRGSGNLEEIFGLDRVRNGMDVHRLIPAWPKLSGTNTGAVDYDALAKLRRFTARTSNDINIPVTIDQVDNGSVFRISSFPHIAGIIVVNPATMRISSSNSVFAAALFGHAKPDGLPINELIPGFDTILRVMTDEDKIGLVDGIVIPEHSFRRARALLALREGSADAAAVFLRPSGVPAQHRDGAEIMIDVQMRVVKSDKEPIYNETVIEENVATNGSSEVVYALWITYSRQLHAVNHGVGPVTPFVSRPSTPPQQPAPEYVPSPMAVASPESSEESDVRIKILDEKLAQVKSPSSPRQMSIPINSSDGEPFEHPSPDLIAANVKVIRKKKIDDFVILEEMGQGAYGQVKLARYKKPGAGKMVIKYVTKRRILVDTWHRDRRLGTVPLEIHVLDYLRRDGLQHPNIVEMADFFEDDINYYIEMVPHGLPGMDLFDYIELRVTMDEPECRKIFRQVAQAIGHLHLDAKVVHRDIKDENVILDGEGNIKLIDFGSAAYIKSGPFDVFVGTIGKHNPSFTFLLRRYPFQESRLCTMLSVSNSYLHSLRRLRRARSPPWFTLPRQRARCLGSRHPPLHNRLQGEPLLLDRRDHGPRPARPIHLVGRLHRPHPQNARP
jgi:protein-serine/threonine kinase